MVSFTTWLERTTWCRKSQAVCKAPVSRMDCSEAEHRYRRELLKHIVYWCGCHETSVRLAWDLSRMRFHGASSLSQPEPVPSALRGLPTPKLPSGSSISQLVDSSMRYPPANTSSES